MADDTHQKIIGIAQHDPEVIESILRSRVANIEESELDPKTYSLVNIAALVALDAAPALYVWQIGLALDAGVTPEEILGVLVAVNPTVGTAKVVAAAPAMALALGMDIDALEAERDAVPPA